MKKLLLSCVALIMTLGCYSQKIEVKQDVTILVDGGAMDFGSVNLGSDKELTFTISNTGDENLIYNLGTITSNQEIVVSSPETLSGYLSPGESTDVTVKFTPQAAGNRTGTFFVGSNDPDDGMFTLNLTGTGNTVTTVQAFEQANATLYMQDQSWFIRGLKSGEYNVQIVSVDGRLNVYNSVMLDGEYRLPTSAVNTGLYTVIMTSGNISLTGKIVVK